MASMWSMFKSGCQRIVSRNMLRLQRLRLIHQSLRWFSAQHRGQFSPSAWTLTLSCSSARVTIESQGSALTAHWQSQFVSNAQSGTSVSNSLWSNGSTSGYGAEQMSVRVQHSFVPPEGTMPTKWSQSF